MMISLLIFIFYLGVLFLLINTNYYVLLYFVCITGQLEMKLRSQVIQRYLPRPPDTNIVLRPMNSEPPLTDLQRVIYLFLYSMCTFMKVIN